MLIIDDDEQVAGLISEMLLAGGHEPVMEKSGIGLLDRIGKLSFEIVITDIVMPEVDGIEIIRQLREVRPEVPIIAISGNENFPAAVGLKFARAFGAFQSLFKPFSMKEMLSAVDEAIQSLPK
ncbi:MAG TPA: response regulator [Terriglobales bacterium]|nr:response regulator [Terriglobales bacterium]